ncbi:putative malate dehydrogenase (oxaloacetate-decarboxylating) (NADP(+)) [Helianthus annuus]|nr:putative malate dehydrogenase (oxaloacetate-decarboxylating) (NADP(+)) [Helianthus annuus]
MNNNSISGVSRMMQSQSLRVSGRYPMVVSMMNRNGRPETSVGVSVDNVVKEVNGPILVEVVDCKLKQQSSVVVEGSSDDVYIEDTSTKDEYVTPLSVSVAR